MTTQTEIEAVAKEVITSLSNHSQIPTFSSRPGGLALAQAYRVIPQLRAAFEARGERITGRKIGFTNRQMWKAFGVESPIWGYTTSFTTHELTDMQVIALNDFSEPRIDQILRTLKVALIFPARGLRRLTIGPPEGGIGNDGLDAHCNGNRRRDLWRHSSVYR